MKNNRKSSKTAQFKKQEDSKINYSNPSIQIKDNRAENTFQLKFSEIVNTQNGNFPIQRAELMEEEIQLKSFEEEELQMKAFDEEELQMKSIEKKGI